MPVFTGTAAGHHDLLNKIVAHLTDGVAMGSQAWQLLSSTDPGGVGPGYQLRYLKAPGLAGTDNIYVNLGTWENVGADIYNMTLRGATNYNPAALWANQPGVSPEVYLTLWNNSIPYTLVANGRRFILIAKISTIFANAYCGFLLPYATSDEYPYPLFIGGNAPAGYRWSQTGYFVGSPWDPTGTSSGYGVSCSMLRHYDGQWVYFQNYYDASGNRSNNSDTDYNIWPWQYFDFQHGNNFDGGYTLYQAIVNARQLGGNVYGDLQGVYFVSGFGNASENVITVDGKNYLVTQNTWRTGRSDYAAILLE